MGQLGIQAHEQRVHLGRIGSRCGSGSARAQRRFQRQRGHMQGACLDHPGRTLERVHQTLGKYRVAGLEGCADGGAGAAVVVAETRECA